MDIIVICLLAAVEGYLLGTIPFGLMLTQIAGLGDIRAIGSGNIGATNVLRTGNKGLAFVTFLLDSGKGAVSAFLAAAVFTDHPHTAALSAGLFAVAGHNFPVWLHFRGGKGVATTLGVLLATVWPVGLLSCLTWISVAVIFRYSSLAALSALTFAPAYALVFADCRAVVVFAGLAVLGWFRHWANIRRLLAGTEPCLGWKRR